MSFTVTGEYNTAAENAAQKLAQRKNNNPVLQAVISGLEATGLEYTPRVENPGYTALDTAVSNIQVFDDRRVHYKYKDWTCEIRDPQQGNIDELMKILVKLSQQRGPIAAPKARLLVDFGPD